MIGRRVFARRALLAGTAAILSQRARAQTRQPDGPVTLIVPFTPGTVQDLIARLLAPGFQTRLGQPVVVDNRAGASGVIGTGAVARAAPDGRMLMIQGVPFVMSPPLMRSLPYDPVRGFTPLVRLADGHVMLVVQPDVPAQNVAEFVALARARPGALDYASPGNGTAQHMTMELFKLTAGIDLTHIPYRGTAPAVQDLLGRRLAAMMLPVPVALPFVRSGQLRALAIGADARSPQAPEVPTLTEAGMAMGEITLWYGLFGPAGMAPALVERIVAASNDWLADPAVREVLRAQSLIPVGGGSEAFSAFVAAELTRWAGVVRDARIAPD